MRNAAIGAGIAAVVSVGVALAAPAAADYPHAVAPGASAVETINHLQSEGYKVIQSKVGNSSIDKCTVSAVRPGRDITELQARPRGNTETVKLYTTVYVDLECKG
ncbi:hypothetical protein [Mycobacterium sp. OTB74]|jgi:hypothetical protein|uniref:hypothetical protein n=1 Tax=Mycobacterium sp. OTB74 TaxID=1853452 RepID=UPI0024766123|nr:hypothetical protein [Mycobacterium sp. OTB74]MDH6246247.1 hypothetical protein [Mycobacterium sp. OTB74]